MPSSAQDSKIRIWQVVSQIPAGKVATYGQVAQLAGLPRAARLVGNCLHGLPADTRLPWHRVINAQGKISLPARSAAYRKQRDRLAAEGVTMLKGKVSLARYQWQP